jgi:hypothetical protein
MNRYVLCGAQTQPWVETILMARIITYVIERSTAGKETNLNQYFKIVSTGVGCCFVLILLRQELHRKRWFWQLRDLYARTTQHHACDLVSSRAIRNFNRIRIYYSILSDCLFTALRHLHELLHRLRRATLCRRTASNFDTAGELQPLAHAPRSLSMDRTLGADPDLSTWRTVAVERRSE